MAMKFDRRTGRWVREGNSADEINKFFPGTTTPAPTTAAPPTTTPRTRTTVAPQGPVAPTTTVGATTTTGKPTTTTVPKRKAPAGPGPAAQAGKRMGVKQTSAIEETLGSAVSEALANVDGTDWAQLAKILLGDGSGGSGWSPNPAAAAAGFAAARQQERAGAAAKQAYENLAAQQLQQAMGGIGSRYATQEQAIKDFYAGQQAQSQQAIQQATADLLATMPASTGFQQAQFATLPQEQQALAQLAAYGATGEEARQLSAQDAAMAQAVQNIMATSAQQMGQAESGYLNALRTAAQGGQAAALQGLVQQIQGGQAAEMAGLRQGRTSEEDAARAIQTQLLTAGLEALMSGRQTAAQTRATTTAEYGRPPKRKGKGKSKGSRG